MYLSVYVPVDKISQKVFNQSTSVLVGGFPVTEGRNNYILRKIARGKGRRGRGGGTKFGHNDKR